MIEGDKISLDVCWIILSKYRCSNVSLFLNFVIFKLISSISVKIAVYKCCCYVSRYNLISCKTNWFVILFVKLIDVVFLNCGYILSSICSLIKYK